MSKDDRPTSSKDDTGDEGLRESWINQTLWDIDAFGLLSHVQFASHQLALLDRVRREMPEKRSVKSHLDYENLGFNTAVDDISALLNTISSELKDSLLSSPLRTNLEEGKIG